MDVIFILLGVLFLLGVGVSMTGRHPLLGTFSIVFGFWYNVAICFAYGWPLSIVGWGIYIVAFLLFVWRYMDEGRLE